MWTKPVMINALMDLRYSVLYSDLDTVWMAPAVHSYALALNEHGADMVAMPESGA